MRFLTVMFCAMLAPGLASANELLRVYDLAARNDTQVQAAAHQRDAALEVRPQARSALLPQISARGSLSDQRDKIQTVDSNPASATFGQTFTQTKSSNPYGLSLNLSQVLFDKAAFERWSQSDDAVAAAEADYANAQQNLALRVSQAYFTLLSAADSLRFSNANVESLQRQLELAKKRFEVGLAAITDVQDAQASYDLAVAQQLQAEQDLANSQQAMDQITGTADVRINPLQEDMPLVGPNPGDVNQWLRAAAEGNLDLQKAKLAESSAKKDVAIQQAGHYPTLSLNGQQARSKQSGFNTFQDDQSSITLQLNVPIFSGGLVHSRVNQAEFTHEQRVAELEGVRRTVESATRNYFKGVNTGVSRVKALKQAVMSNTTALEASGVGLEVGTRTQVDVLNAQQKLFGVQRDYSRARYDYLLSVLQLKQATGHLTQSDLGEIDRLLTAGEPASAPAR